MNPMLATILLRMIERIGDVVIGGLAIYYGYTLFLRLPDLKNSQGEVKWGDRSVILSRIGPGVFFALFGVAVTLVSLYRPVSFGTSSDLLLLMRNSGETPAAAMAVASPETTSNAAFSGIGANPSTPTASPEALLRIRGDISLLNSLEGKLGSGANTTEQRDFDLALPRIKLAMIESVWNEAEWSDRILFQQAVLNNEVDCTNVEKGSAAELYCYGSQGSSQ